LEPVVAVEVLESDPQVLAAEGAPQPLLGRCAADRHEVAAEPPGFASRVEPRHRLGQSVPAAVDRTPAPFELAVGETEEAAAGAVLRGPERVGIRDVQLAWYGARSSRAQVRDEPRAR